MVMVEMLSAELCFAFREDQPLAAGIASAFFILGIEG
jgi:hypothetical protein